MQKRFLSKMLLGLLALAATAVASAPSPVMVSGDSPAAIAGPALFCSIEISGIWK